MPDMKNNITKAVFFTVRDIENKIIFKGVTPQPSKSIIDYLVSRKDGLSEWLNGKVQSNSSEKREEEESIEQFKLIPEDVKERANAFEKQYGCVISDDSPLISTIVDAKDLSELQGVKGSFMESYNELSAEDKSAWELVFNFLCHIPDVNLSEIEISSTTKFTINAYNNELAESILNSDVTHCDKQSQVYVKDRLGWYRKEDDTNGDSVVCAVNPWAGEPELEHNIQWAEALLSSLTEEYPSLQSIILVCHDRDFNGYSGKDEVVSGLFFDELKRKHSNLEGLVVFQHSNNTIMGALNKSIATDVFNAIEKYAKGFDRLKKADESNGNANAHENYSKMVNQKED